MESLAQRLSVFLTFDLEALVHVVDILLVAYLNYRLLKLIRGTRAWKVVGGVAVYVAALFLSDRLQLSTLHWILDKATALAPVALVLLLLPELRQALEGFARLGLWPERIPVGGQTAVGAEVLAELEQAALSMASSHTGALIILERTDPLDEIINNGVRVGASLSATLLETLFYEGNPLHDGAVVVRQGTIVAAACRLPVSERDDVPSHVHLRHRAALGMTEQADCVAVIVSEERGAVSVAVGQELFEIDDKSRLREILNRELRGIVPDSRLRPRRRRGNRAETLADEPTVEKV